MVQRGYLGSKNVLFGTWTCEKARQFKKYRRTIFSGRQTHWSAHVKLSSLWRDARPPSRAI
jgi:hypothetical protein